MQTGVQEGIHRQFPPSSALLLMRLGIWEQSCRHACKITYLATPHHPEQSRRLCFCSPDWVLHVCIWILWTHVHVHAYCIHTYLLSAWSCTWAWINIWIYIYIYIQGWRTLVLKCKKNNYDYIHAWFFSTCILALMNMYTCTKNRGPQNGFERFLAPVYYPTTVEKSETDNQLFCKWQYCDLQNNWHWFNRFQRFFFWYQLTTGNRWNDCQLFCKWLYMPIYRHLAAQKHIKHAYTSWSILCAYMHARIHTKKYFLYIYTFTTAYIHTCVHTYIHKQE